MVSPAFFRVDGSTGKCAVYEAAPADTKVHALDYSNADPRDRPLYKPTDWINLIHLHTDFDNLEVAFHVTVNKTHKTIPAATQAVDGLSMLQDIVHDTPTAIVTEVLFNHNLGYVPHAIVFVNKMCVTPGFPVQQFSDGRGRYASVWADTKSIWLETRADQTGLVLPAITLAYGVMVFRKPPAAKITGGKIDPAFHKDPVTGIVTMAGGRWLSTKAYVQVLSSGTALFAIFTGPTMDAKNGAEAVGKADGTIFKPVPATQKATLSPIGHDDLATSYKPGVSMAYNGTYKPANIFKLAAP